ncbi:MAG: TVP38/TMEM64 family protein [Gammaproteobacteria bacterium]|nr:TVP38/TMEM64 family protein [Gammaproteobacteria bacterium]MCP5136197.1 TVP38/TMEM64 family protein [Gammaproteobacteria bacterium]
MSVNIARWLRMILVLALVALMGLAWTQRELFDIDTIRAWLSVWPDWAPALFMLIYAVLTVLMVPGTALTLAGGAVFGLAMGTIFNLFGATLGAALAFLVARHLAGGLVRRRVGGRMLKLIEGVEREGWRFVVFTRLVPLFPFVLLNYGFGLTRIPFGQYLAATLIAMLPGAFAYTWLGHAGGEALRGDKGAITQALLALAALAVVSYLPRLWRNRRQ